MLNGFDKKKIYSKAAKAPSANASFESLRINTEKNKEKLVSLDQGKVKFFSVYHGYTKNIAPYHYTFDSTLRYVWVREALVEKLEQVNIILANYGYELLVLDGFRTINLQKELWSWFVKKAAEQMNLPVSSPAVVKNAEDYCSNPESFKLSEVETYPLHFSGAAIDLTLMPLEGKQPVFMGGIFDDPSEVSHTTYFETEGVTRVSDFEAQRNRRILYWAMTQEGFANLESEWWHFEYGGRTWKDQFGKDECYYSLPPNCDDVY